MTTEIIYICGTCNRTLDTLVDTSGVTQIHTHQDLPADHTPVPVAMPPGWTGGRCDFCNEQPIEFVLPANDFRLPFAEHAMSGGDWAMCKECAGLVQQDRWGALTRRAANSFVQLHGPFLPHEVERVSTQLASAYRKLRREVTGAVRPLS